MPARCAHCASSKLDDHCKGRLCYWLRGKECGWITGTVRGERHAIPGPQR